MLLHGESSPENCHEAYSWFVQLGLEWQQNDSLHPELFAGTSFSDDLEITSIHLSLLVNHKLICFDFAFLKEEQICSFY